MTTELSLSQIEAKVNLVHFQSSEHLSNIVRDRLLHFQNVRKYPHEANVLWIDSAFYSAETIGVFCFSYDMKALFNAEMWGRFGTKLSSKSVCVGFWEAGAEAVPNTSGTLENAIALSMRNHRKMINNHHKMSEAVYVGRPDYLPKSELSDFRNLPPCTKDIIENATEIMLITFEPRELSSELEERFIILDCPDSRDVSFTSRFIPQPKVLILGPDVEETEAEQFVQEYRNDVQAVSKASAETGDRVSIRRIWL